MPVANLNGTEIHWRDAGSGSSAVVLLHAFPLHSGMWARQIAALERKHRVIALDYRGLGKSGTPPEASTLDLLAGDVRALLAHLRVGRAAVAGLSMGGYLAFELYRQAPGLFRGVAFCDTKAGADDDIGKANREKFARTALEKGLGWVADEMVPKLLRPGADAAVVKEVRHLILDGTPAGVAAAQRGMAKRQDSVATLATIACPALVVVGAEDGMTPPAEARKIADGVKGAKLVTIPDAGHLANVENPAAFDAALTAFVDGLPA
ncbi:alpha/beta fold hydrolase [Anaeromyxobacter dehalogenans]|uniref:Alpha/beta hydrolase fold-1 n=1 Tax=Anaeromyxobacter dehalogenans (strain 2CP-C) TaxID=290397 RepID=Q2IGA8_ANADE|nr:alpha/beta fold hydrolase [Anaeromyxobacter dehalogenans]ABC83613.1 Alpha/beta hydrolase fold-1 [Anaeromyxobacter dehalogenans 2CP-C]